MSLVTPHPSAKQVDLSRTSYRNRLTSLSTDKDVYGYDHERPCLLLIKIMNRRADNLVKGEKLAPSQCSLDDLWVSETMIYAAKGELLFRINSLLMTNEHKRDTLIRGWRFHNAGFREFFGD
ncbi:hypothetical protein [Anoxynatronum sibiricum]|uniref:hypothetical protein n=1 Tax=Anoxynatronum sibiricum TaxID=210623 RepID=UPI0031B8A275